MKRLFTVSAFCVALGSVQVHAETDEAVLTETGVESPELSAEIVAKVDISTQKMVVEVDGEQKFTWDVSTAREGKETPLGIYDVEWLSAKHKSSLYNNAPMPWAIFYDGDYAIHGTTQINKLGSPASAGCVRLHPDNAKLLFKMVQKRGYDSLKVVVAD